MARRVSSSCTAADNGVVAPCSNDNIRKAAASYFERVEMAGRFASAIAAEEETDRKRLV